jgi:DNA-binding XRE family transcriptional regulator
MEIAEIVRKRREMLHMTQAELAIRSNMSRQSIIALEATGECRLSSLLRIAQTLDLKLSLEPYGDDG